MMPRTLGRSGVQVSTMGMGCWAIGGPFWLDGRADGWGDVDDAQSIRAVHLATDLGVTLFDTADVYGAGHSETVLGRALADRRERVVIATKFGYTFDEATKRAEGTDVTPAYIRRACQASLRRLGTDYIDLYQLHVGEITLAQAAEVAATLEDLRREGLIRAFGWSTDTPACALRWVGRAGCVSVQHDMNLFNDRPEMVALTAEQGWASINRSPLAMGMLSGKFSAASQLANSDVRGAGHTWVPYFEDGRPRPEYLARLDAVREILSSGGRTLAQGALAWLWARGAHTIPIPGFKTERQVTENAGAMAFGPLAAAQMDEIDAILGRGGAGD